MERPDPARLQGPADDRARRARHSLRLLQSLDPKRLDAALGHCGTLAGQLDFKSTGAHNELRSLLEVGKAALDRSRAKPGAVTPLSPLETDGLEAIVVTVGRPAILIRDDHFDTPVDPWTDLEQYRADIERVTRSVGRIELTGHASLDWVGTGFLIAPGVLATNRHVVQEFASRDWQGRWRIDSGITARVDFSEELGSVAPREFAIDSIEAVHDLLDVALLRMGAGTTPQPPPLRLDAGGTPLGPGQKAYVVGYPALDSRRNDAATMQRIFSDIYNVKRLQPGYVVDWSAPQAAYQHDCSTLGGNSGSCLVDLASGVVVGVHFGGRFGEANWAVSTRDLAADPLLTRLGASFT